VTSGDNKFKYFPENQLTKLFANYPNFMQYLETREQCNKTVTGQYGSSTVLQQLNDQSNQQ